MQSQVDEIKAKLDIVDIIQEYFPLKQAGVNMKAVCPFHEEKTPSFMVSRERQMWHCFGACNDGGDIFTFIQKMENIEFPEALKILANKAGVELKYRDSRVTNLKTRLINIHEDALDFFVGNLLNTETGKEANNYLQDKRKIDSKTITEWQLGYALDSWNALSSHLQSSGYNNQEILQSGLVVSKNDGRYYDRFRARLMFPIADYHGNIIAFTGRTMKSDEMAKYINSPSTLIYNKSEVIYGLSKAKQFIKEKDAVVIVEGNMDVISSSQAGVKNVVAVSGTALTSEQVRILKRYTNNIIFCFDADSAGITAVNRGIEIAWQNGANVRVIALDKKIGKDPDDIARQDQALWKKLVNEAKPAMEYFFMIEFQNYDAYDINIKKQVAKNLLNMILKLIDPIEQDFYIRKLGDKLGVAENILREFLAKILSEGKVRNKTDSHGVEKSQKMADKRNQFLQRLLALMIIDIDFADYASSNLPVEYLPSNFQDIYKSIIIYYTKNQDRENSFKDNLRLIQSDRPDLAEEFNAIGLLAGSEFADTGYDILGQEAKRIVCQFKKEGIKKQLMSIAQDLKEAERLLSAKFFSSPDEEKKQRSIINELMKSFTALVTELREVDKMS
ncbi:DNA primase [Candidatus Kuenenbacteria bacterium CG08_land_8_20_14_0_20_37_23]|uniref:DNA primase n=2 Tax=Candidatus Kueneniibacteriota TaxID=1752740 RepID=A0A2M6XS52_9BACT|nr:MAG: DNA primase [Candidatus Kuenenbacteria bacterium CG1_02_38_13]PIU10431.1 MAG: DNA primase [Candidatus Kuenenbacteria bacterium CG08_land_8_20_14_0_20_37_23]